MSWWRKTDEEKELEQAQQEQAQQANYNEEGYRMVEDTRTSDQINKELAQAMQDYLKANKK